MTAIIKFIAAREHTTTVAIQAEIEAAIAAAWQSTDRKTKRSQMALTGKYRAPTPEELIQIIASHAKNIY